MRLTSATFEFEQGPDDCGEAQDQYLKIDVCDAGAGKYLVLSTERWAIDHPEHLTNLTAIVLRSINELEEKLK